jgi:trimeric autotransporter adhesin
MKILFLPCASLCLLFLFFAPLAFSQNVGIGTTAPAFKLDVKNGSINTDSVYRIAGSKILSAPLQNTFVGIGADSSITTGNNNTVIGFRALYSNTTGDINTAIGSTSLYQNTTGYRNTAIGSSSLYSNTTGFYNTAIGTLALANNTSSDNTAVGYYALAFSTTGRFNTATGVSALLSNTIGSGNVANGYQALYSNITGDFNSAFGYDALYSNTTGFINTAFGNQALYSNTTGNYNTAIGVSADVLTGGLSNATVIGRGAKVDASNKVRIGNTQITSIGGAVGWSTFSDGRYKQNIQEDVPGIAFINKLHPVTYTVDVKSLDENYYKLKPGMAAVTNTLYRYTGFIAQEVEQSAAAIGFNFSGVDKPQQPDKMYGLRYAEFVVPLVKAVQEQQQQIENLKREIAMLKEIVKNK